jgi:hypothetical protein
LAEQDLARPSASEDEVALGDGWWDVGERVSATAKAQVRQRACSWYGKVLSGLDNGLVRQKIEQRFQETTTSASAEKPAGEATAQTFRWSDLPRYANLRLVPSWERLRPRKTLQAQTIKGAMTLSRAVSPYLVIGFLAVEPDATLTIEPGVTVLFAPGAQLSNKGTLVMKSEGDWIVLAPAERGQKWKGVYSRGHIAARQCLVVGADRGLWIEEVKDGLAATQCVFAGNGSGVMAGDHSNCSLEDCLLFKNDSGLMTGGGGAISFSRCLLVSNGKGYAADYSGRCAGTRSTLFANGIGVESGIYGDANELHLCNIVGNTKFQAATRGDGASISVRQNYWGQDVARAIAAGQARTLRGKVDAIEWLEKPVTDALPSLPRCEYLAY